jgi:hypothetical protein
MSVSDLVGELEGLRDRTRRASSGGAVPLALLGLLTALAAPFYAGVYGALPRGGGVYGLADLVGPYRPPVFVSRFLRLDPGGPHETRLAVYWLAAVPVAFLLVAGYYAWRARRTGISLNGWRVAVTGLAVIAALLVAVELPAHGLAADYAPNHLRAGNFVNPLLVVAAGAFAIACVERSRGLLAVAVAFLAGVVVFDTRVLADRGAGGWDNLASAGTATLVLAAWLLVAAAVTAVVAFVRRRA